jgi:hypothetical protein
MGLLFVASVRLQTLSFVGGRPHYKRDGIYSLKRGEGEGKEWCGGGTSYCYQRICSAEGHAADWPASSLCASFYEVNSPILMTPAKRMDYCFWVHAVAQGASSSWLFRRQFSFFWWGVVTVVPKLPCNPNTAWCWGHYRNFAEERRGRGLSSVFASLSRVTITLAARLCCIWSCIAPILIAASSSVGCVYLNEDKARRVVGGTGRS